MRPETTPEATSRAAEVKEQGETNLYHLSPREAEGKEKPEIMVGARDMGTARILVPVIEELLNRGYPISLLTDQPAEQFLKDKFATDNMEELQINSPLGAVAEREPGLILSGISATGGSGIEFYLTTTAEEYGGKTTKRVPSIWIEDFWGVATRKGQMDYKIEPDLICAFDEYSKSLDIEHLKEAGLTKPSPDQFVATGSPVFDDIAKEQNRDEIQNKLRKELNILDGEKFIAYVGGAPPKDLENLKILIENLNELNLGDKKIALAVRIHPSVFRDTPLAQYKKDYENLLSSFNNGKVVETMGKFSTDQVATAADMVITSYSTEGVKAVYRGKPSLFMLLPGLGADGLKDSVDLKTLPVIESGASIGVFKEEDMKQGLENLLDADYQKTMQRAQQTHHNLDGNNTKRVADLVEKMLNN
jgi:hypothetical protein